MMKVSSAYCLSFGNFSLCLSRIGTGAPSVSMPFGRDCCNLRNERPSLSLSDFGLRFTRIWTGSL